MILDITVLMVLIGVCLAIINAFSYDKNDTRTYSDFRKYDDRVIELRARQMILVDKAY